MCMCVCIYMCMYCIYLNFLLDLLLLSYLSKLHHLSSKALAWKLLDMSLSLIT